MSYSTKFKNDQFLQISGHGLLAPTSSAFSQKRKLVMVATKADYRMVATLRLNGVKRRESCRTVFHTISALV